VKHKAGCGNRSFNAASEDPSPEIYGNFFNELGAGPATLKIELFTFPPMGIYEAPTLSLQFHLVGMTIIKSPAGGGIHLGERHNVVELHRQLTKWLEDHPQMPVERAEAEKIAE